MCAHLNSFILHYKFLMFFSEFGKNPQIVNFLGNHINMRRSEGSMVSTGVSPYPAMLHGYIQGARWDDAVRLCRFVKVCVYFGLNWHPHSGFNL